MSREIRRVPLNFNWPLDKVWEGYPMPDRLRGKRCTACRDGMTPAAAWLYKLGSRIDMLAEDIGEQERGRQMHPYLSRDMDAATTDYVYEGPRLVSEPKVLRPSADILEVVAGLTGNSPERLKSSMRGIDDKVTHAIIAAAGLDPSTWGICPTCEGRGSVEVYPGQRAEADAWEREDPPTGEGWQMWETVSEGSPQTPVFDSPEGLVNHLVNVEGYRLEAARTLVSSGGSGVTGFVVGGVVYDGAKDIDLLVGD